MGWERWPQGQEGASKAPAEQDDRGRELGKENDSIRGDLT